MVSLVSGTKRHDYFIWKTVVWHTVTGKMLSGTKQLQSTEPLSGRICLEQNILSREIVASYAKGAKFKLHLSWTNRRRVGSKFSSGSLQFLNTWSKDTTSKCSISKISFFTFDSIQLNSIKVVKF